MLPRIRSTSPWINKVKTLRPQWLHNSAPSPLRPPALLFGGINHSHMVQPREWPQLASGVLGPCKTKPARMVINLKPPALLALTKNSQRVLLAVRMSPTSTGRFRIRANHTPPALSTVLLGAHLATNGDPGEVPTWLGLTTGAPQLMICSEDYLPWTLILNIRRPPSLVHSPTTHHASIRISHSSSRHCEAQHRMTVMAVPCASCNLSQTRTSVVIRLSEAHRVL